MLFHICPEWLLWLEDKHSLTSVCKRSPGGSEVAAISYWIKRKLFFQMCPGSLLNIPTLNPLADTERSWSESHNRLSWTSRTKSPLWNNTLPLCLLLHEWLDDIIMREIFCDSVIIWYVASVPSVIAIKGIQYLRNFIQSKFLCLLLLFYSSHFNIGLWGKRF